MFSENSSNLPDHHRALEVVLVEDDTSAGGLECQELERAGMAVRVVGSCEDALRVANEHPPDCWLIDQVLCEGTNGLQLVSELRKSHHYEPVILLTVRDDLESVLQGLRSGVRDFVRRGPGFTEVLVSRVQALIESVRTEQALERMQARAETEELRRRELESEIGERRKAEHVARNAVEHLEEIDRRKDAFLAMLGHELRSPLAPISNAVEVLRAHGNSSAQVRWAVEVVGRQMTQLRRLVDDLLDVARITYGRFQLAFAPVSLNDIVMHAVERCRSMVEARRHVLVVTSTNGPLTAYGDSSRLEQALVNLLENAVKYTPDGGRLTLTLRSEDGDGVIRIADNGIGIHAKDLAAIFQLFVQGDRDIAPGQGGLGIGLSLVRRVAELHGGRVEVTSPGVGKGSEFTLRLPLSRMEPTFPAANQALPTAVQGKRVVVVDDDRDSAESMAMLLRLWGFEVDVENDGESGIALIQSTHPDAVLLDLGLPGLDGLHVAERLHEYLSSHECLLVAVTGYGQQRDRDRTQKAGFNRHLVKPVAIETLREALSPLLVT